jgi:multiple sugar transport system ATP-binding protein
MAAIEIDAVSKVFAGDVRAVDDVTLTVADGEFLVLVGPSGCGKSTLLRMIAGLEEVTSGAIRIGGEDVTGLAPRRRDLAMVFQSYALYPHMTVRQNLAYGLKVRRAPKALIAQRVTEVAEMLGLSELLKRKPAELSGGQRQRVAMGRAIAREPRAFLMDEPLSNLDAKLRVEMRTSLQQLHTRLGITTVYVTHDQVEAMTLGNRVAVMRDGRLLQVDTPQRLYAQPRDLVVAAFIGSPAMNLVEATLEGDDVVFGQFRIRLAGRRPPVATNRVVLGIRPEVFEDGRFAAPGLPRIDVAVSVLEELGYDAHVLFPVEAAQITAETLGAEESASLLVSEPSLFTARVDARTSARLGERLELAVDPDRLQFFDPGSGRRLLVGGDVEARADAPVPA